jgi:hypothetical protein
MGRKLGITEDAAGSVSVVRDYGGSRNAKAEKRETRRYGGEWGDVGGLDCEWKRCRFVTCGCGIDGSRKGVEALRCAPGPRLIPCREKLRGLRDQNAGRVAASLEKMYSVSGAASDTAS